MDSKSKGGWGLPVIVAVGAFAYYCATLTFNNDPHPRRRVILQRLYDGTSPRTLLREGFTRAELLDAGVPRASLTPSTPTAAHATTSPASARDGSEEASPLRSSLSPLRADIDGGNNTSRKDALHWLYESLLSVSGTLHAASGTLVETLRGRSDSSSTASPREVKPAEARDGSTHAGTAPAPVSAVLPAPSREVASVAGAAAAGAAAPPASSSVQRASHLTSSLVRLSPALFVAADEEKKCAASLSPERSRSRTPGGAQQVRLAALSAAIARGYTEESATYRYPLEVLRFLHEDGSRLSVMAESCGAVESAEPITTEAYVRCSLARARAAADASKTYFKVKLQTAARNIATTVMASYVNAHVGPSPVILASFYLVARGVAYTIQLQTHTGVYEERLADLLYTAQSARLHDDDDDNTRFSSNAISIDNDSSRTKDLAVAGASNAVKSASRHVGHYAFEIQAVGVEERYTVIVPLDFVAAAERSASGCRSTLILRPRNSTEERTAWQAQVEAQPRSSRTAAATPTTLNATEARKTTILLEDAQVSILLSVHDETSCSSASTTDNEALALLQLVTARATQGDAAPGTATPATTTTLPVNAYVSPSLVLPLPQPESFRTTVCEHTRDPFVTLFITSAANADVADVFEVEVRCMTHLPTAQLDAFFTYLTSLFLTPSNPQRVLNSAGQEAFAVEGLAATPPETSLRVYGVQVCEGGWFVTRWLYADSAVFPRELEQYRRTLVDDVAC